MGGRLREDEQAERGARAVGRGATVTEDTRPCAPSKPTAGPARERALGQTEGPGGGGAVWAQLHQLPLTKVSVAGTRRHGERRELSEAPARFSLNQNICCHAGVAFL